MTAADRQHLSLLRERQRACARDAAQARAVANYVLASRFVMQELHVRRLLDAASYPDRRLL